MKHKDVCISGGVIYLCGDVENLHITGGAAHISGDVEHMELYGGVVKPRVAYHDRVVEKVIFREKIVEKEVARDDEDIDELRRRLDAALMVNRRQAERIYNLECIIREHREKDIPCPWDVRPTRADCERLMKEFDLFRDI